MRKGWRAGILGWHGGFQKRNWEDVTPHVELKATQLGAKVEYRGSGEETVLPGSSFSKEMKGTDLPSLVGEGEDANAKKEDVKGFSSVTHVSVHVPVDKTPDGFYKFVITDANDKA